MRNSLLMLVAAVALTGCASGGYRPFSEEEKVLFATGFGLNAGDAAMTSAAIGSGQFEESNDFYSHFNMEDNGGIIATKLAIQAATYIGCQLFPNHRKQILWGNIISGGVPCVWNGYQMATH
jgi:hypothetical protein